jgi:sucrose-6-phosphate hydrolase SacC (GH32 family)
MKKMLPVSLAVLSLSMLPAPMILAEDPSPNQFYFLPEKDGIAQGYVGDCMPYYEDGVYYIYYLKEGGDSYHHSIYLATTTDFLTYTDYEDPILEAADPPAQDDWVGTGSVVKVDDTYYLFYTGHTETDSFEYAETVMLATGSDPTSFEKTAEWEMTPDDSLNQKRDFRDPQGYYDEETGQITFTVTASVDGVARILKYTVSKDLSEITYDGIIFTDPIGKVYNLECSDTFKIGDTWYLTYSAQDDVLWYASSEDRYGPYSDPKPLDGPLFYAAKHVENGEQAYMAGWARRSGSERDTRKVSEWAGNLVVQQIKQLPDGSLVLEPVDAIAEQFQNGEALELEADSTTITAQDREYFTLCNAADSYMLTGNFKYEGEGSFGLGFDFKDGEEDYKLITYSPQDQKLCLQFRGGDVTPAEETVALEAGETYPFTYIQEVSVGVFYIEDTTAFTVRLYGVSDKPLMLFAENNQVEFTDLNVAVCE